MTMNGSRACADTSSLGLSTRIGIGSGLGVFAGAAWDMTHRPPT